MMEHDHKREVASCSIGIAASLFHTISWPFSAHSIQTLIIRLDGKAKGNA
jgi:hypothetical protein